MTFDTEWEQEEIRQEMLKAGADPIGLSAFLNRLRSLYNINGSKLPELTVEEQRDFVRDPSGYMRNKADKPQLHAIWREIEARQ
jgi:hypothetical protein